MKFIYLSYFINADLNKYFNIFINKTFLLKLIWKGYKNVLINIYTIIIKNAEIEIYFHMIFWFFWPIIL